MGLNSGGKGYEAVREQSRRLSLCRLTFYRVTEVGEAVLNGGFVREAILPSRDVGAQLSLWRETVVLDEVFYESLIRHPLPLSRCGLRESHICGTKYPASDEAIQTREATSDCLGTGRLVSARGIS
jgi:hypothetical protein